MSCQVSTRGALASWPSDIMKFAAFMGAALAMGVGSALGGHRVTEVLAEKVTAMDHVEGLAANLTTSVLVSATAMAGLPVSTTHVSGSAIIAVGARKGATAIRWATVTEIVLAWAVTVPVSAALAGLLVLLLRSLP
jgi:PiT family inorganic phosphate transporter